MPVAPREVCPPLLIRVPAFCTLRRGASGIEIHLGGIARAAISALRFNAVVLEGRLLGLDDLRRLVRSGSLRSVRTSRLRNEGITMTASITGFHRDLGGVRSGIYSLTAMFGRTLQAFGVSGTRGSGGKSAEGEIGQSKMKLARKAGRSK